MDGAHDAVSADIDMNDGTDPQLRQRQRIWWLFGIGFTLVAFAGSIAQILVPKFTIGGATGWSPEASKDIAETVRLLGLMFFAIGLVERIAGAISERSK